MQVGPEGCRAKPHPSLVITTCLVTISPGQGAPSDNETWISPYELVDIQSPKHKADVFGRNRFQAGSGACEY